MKPANTPSAIPTTLDPKRRRCLQEISEPLAAASAQHEPRPIIQDDAVLAVEPWLELLDSIQVDDTRAMNPNETLGVEMALKSADGFSMKMRLLARVNDRAVRDRKAKSPKAHRA